MDVLGFGDGRISPGNLELETWRQKSRRFTHGGDFECFGVAFGAVKGVPFDVQAQGAGRMAAVSRDVASGASDISKGCQGLRQSWEMEQLGYVGRPWV